MTPSTRVDDRIRVPRYMQVYSALQQWIAQGKYPPNSQLEPESRLCEMFGVSRITVRKAINLLAEDGLVISQQGKGTFVNQGNAQLPVRADMGQRIRKSHELALNSSLNELLIETIKADSNVCSDLQLPPDSQVIFASYVRVLRDQRIGFVESHIPLHLNILPKVADFKTSTLLTILEDKGIQLSGIDHLIGAALADTRMAKTLSIQVGAPLVRIKMIMLDLEHKPVQLVQAHFRADQYEHHMFLARPE